MVSKKYNIIKRLEENNPYPEDVFTPISKEQLEQIDKVLNESFGFHLDRLSAHIGRQIRKGIIREIKG